MKKKSELRVSYDTRVKKLLLIMRLSILLLVTSVLTSAASSVYSQNTLLTLKMGNSTISQVFDAIEQQSEFYFFYNRDKFDDTRMVSVNVREKNIDVLMKQLLEGQDFYYEIVDRNILIKPKGVDESSEVQQQRAVTGKVTDRQGQALPGVTVVLKGTTNGTITDINGQYNLSGVQPESVLVYSFIGMKTQEIVVGNQTAIHISLVEEAIGIEEVVAIGYGTQKKVNLTGAVASVEGEEIVRRPVTNAESMLQGRMAGVQIIQNSGEPGGEGVSIRIRGTGTFSSAGSNPLVLIDGVQGDLSDLNPNNIESISVLKDAASASIYGARAANGVILVTTKMGKEGKVNLEYSGNYAVHTPTKMFELITNSAEYMELYNEARINSGLSTGLYPQDIINSYRNATDRNLYPNTDWIDLLFDPAPTQTHNLSFNGGANGTTFNVSLGFINQEGVMKGFDYKRYNIRMNLSSRVNDKIKFGGNFSVKKGEKTAPRQGATDTFLAAMSQPPTYAPQLADGSGRYTYKAYDFESNNKNPMAIIGNKVNRNTDDYAITSQGWVDVSLSKQLNWYTKAAINLDFSKYDDFRPIVPLYNYHTNQYMTNLDVGGEGLIVQDDQNVYTNFFSYLNYTNEFAEKHTVNAQVGFSTEENVYQYLRGYRKVYPKDDLRQLDAGSLSVQQSNGTMNEWALMSFFGRFGYNYRDRYLFETNVRYDGTSRLHSDLRWGIFPSFSAGWRISEESFFRNLNLNIINSLKLRGSFGTLGNQNIGLYPYQAILSLTSNYSFDDSGLSSGVAQTGLANEKIKWETTTVLDFGLDLTAFDGLNVTFDWYKKRTTDILRSSQVTDAVGLSAPIVNNGTMENTGLELGVNYYNSVKGGFFSGLNYNIGLIADHYKNRLVDFGAREISGYYLREEGYEWDSYYMLEYDGIFRSVEEITSSPKQFNDVTLPGDLKFKDQNGDKKIDNDDRVPITGRYPALNYGMNLGANWKNFDFSAQFQGIYDVKYFVSDWGTVPFVQGSPPTTEWRDRWTENNRTASMPRLYWGWLAPDRIRRSSSWYLQDGSYLRLKNLVLGYTLPSAALSRIGVNQLRLYFSGDNLLTFTSYPGLDPERGGSGSFVNYPQNKIYSLGLTVKF